MTKHCNNFLLTGLVAFITIAGTISSNTVLGQFGGFPYPVSVIGSNLSFPCPFIMTIPYDVTLISSHPLKLF
jgi:uncharacterized membrane protein